RLSDDERFLEDDIYPLFVVALYRIIFLFLDILHPPISTLFPYTTLFRSIVLPDVVVQLENPPFAVALGQEPVDAAADGIDQAAVRVGKIRQAGQMPVDRHVAEHHVVAGVFARRKEFGESLGPPQRHADLAEPRIPAEGLGREAQLENVHQLVANRVPEFGVAAAERERDPPLQELRDTEQAFRRNEGEDVRLLEVTVRRVDDQRDTARDGVIEATLERVVARFGVCKGDAAELFFFRIVVEIDVLAA